MKILLIEPAKSSVTIGGEDVFLYEPLALEYVAAGVSKDHDVTILDMRLDKNLESALSAVNPQVVGITAYTVHVNTVRKLFERVKSWNPEILTVVGGHHATIMPQDFVSSHIDLIVMGEGVLAFKEIVERFERGQDLYAIAGIAFAKGEKLTANAAAAVTDLDVFPFPDRALTKQYRQHYFSEWMKPLASIRTSKGCPFRCTFCALWKMTNGRYLKRRPEKVVEELAGLDEKYVFFADDESLVDARRMEALAEQIKAAGIQKNYFLYGRSDTIAKNPDLLRLWKGIGLERVFVGLEFFRDQDLVDIHKGSTLKDNQRAVQILQNLDIEVYASFIVRPDYGKADFAACKQYSHDLGLTFASFAVLTPLPGTDFYDEVQGQLITHNYDYFDFIHTLLPTTLPLKQFYREYQQLVMNAISPSKKLAFLRKIPLGELPGLMTKSLRLYRQIKRAYLDYEGPKGISA